jgi:hypothetical protein
MLEQAKMTSALLVVSHKTAIARDIGREDGCQPPLDAFVGQEAPFERLGLGIIGPNCSRPASGDHAAELRG